VHKAIAFLKFFLKEMSTNRASKFSAITAITAGLILFINITAFAINSDQFEGKHFRGRGDVDYLQLLDISRRMFEPDPEFQNISMLYIPDWNGFMEGPTWKAWWIQNSFGTTYCALPFLEEPYLTFLQNSQDLWFDQMGDGKRIGGPGKIVAPDGSLCDCAAPGWVIYKQGDGRTDIHDWGFEFTAAGIIMQSELLLISRDSKAISHYLPMLERCANFIETRRDPKNNLFLAGPAANLLAPSYAGWKRADGSYDRAYLAGLSINYIAALNRLIELEKLAGAGDKPKLYAQRRNLARKGLRSLLTKQGYFIKSLDPDGTRHGVFGASQYGYFEASPNHDAIAFRVVDDRQAQMIYEKIASIPGLRPYDFIIPNYPSLDDMYEKPEGLWAFGTWVNGGHWSTCEARMMLGYYRLGKFEDARKSMKQLLTFADKFKMDNPLTKFGSNVYQPKEAINLCYDTFGPAAGFIRGLFEYLYSAEGLTLIPHIPQTISELQQLDPVRLGKKKLYLSTAGSGQIALVRINGQRWRSFNKDSVFLPYDKIPDTARIEVFFGNESLGKLLSQKTLNLTLAEMTAPPRGTPVGKGIPADLRALDKRANKLKALYEDFEAEGLGESYEASHILLALKAIRTIHQRKKLLSQGKISQLPEPSQTAADKSYIDTAYRLCDGLERVLRSYENSTDPHKKLIYKSFSARMARQR
jgi:hypothetical protein